jgi:hypothetical protein
MVFWRMIKCALTLAVLLSLSSSEASAFSLPVSQSEDKFEAEDCPSTIRQAAKSGKRDASKFSSRHPIGTWGAFLSTGKVKTRKCSPLMKKAYLEAARKAMTKKVGKRRIFTPKRSLTRQLNF